MERRRLLILVGLAVAALALVGISLALVETGDPEPAALVTPSSSTSSTTTSTTVAAATTTTTEPPPTVSVSVAGAPPELVSAVAGLYEWVALPAGATSPAAVPGVLAHLEGVTGGESLDLTGEAAVSELPDLGSVAVVVIDDDVVLAVDDGAGWEIVGVKAPRWDLPPMYGQEVRLAMIIGSDARPGENQQRLRADSLHIAAAAPAIGAGAIVGFPRDSWVDTPYGDEDKFTHVMAGRGPEVVLETARRLTGLPIEGYFVTGFLGFTDLVDAFGGVEVDIPFSMSDEASQAFFRAGLQLLLGDDALAFSRNRHLSGGDLTRSFHQGVVIHAGLVAVQSRGILGLPALLEMLLQHVWTDLDAASLLTMAAAAFELDPLLVDNMVLPARLGRVGSASVVFLEPEAEEIYRDLEDGYLEPVPADE